MYLIEFCANKNQKFYKSGLMILHKRSQKANNIIGQCILEYCYIVP